MHARLMTRSLASARVSSVKSLMFATALFLPELVIADHEHGQKVAAASDPPIEITINPEARVSVTLAGALPPPAACGGAVVFRIKIINQGFVTSRLEADLVGDESEGTTIGFHPEPLKGVPEELRDLRITLIKPGSTDLTLSFRTHNNTPELGGRDRIHFLMRCLRSMTGKPSHEQSIQSSKAQGLASLPTGAM
jgi:hypothetical protein